MKRETMVCPCCGGTIEIEHGTEGACDTCMTFMAAGEIVKDPNYTPDEEDYESEWWVFTFGCGQKHEGMYVRVYGDFSTAREKMFAKYGKKWAMQYSQKEWEDWEARAKKDGFPIETMLEEIK